MQQGSFSQYKENIEIQMTIKNKSLLAFSVFLLHSPLCIGNSEPVKNQSNIETPQKTDKHFFLEGNIGFISNYMSRGATQTFGKPAIQGGLTVKQKEDRGFYFGLWGSNVSTITVPNGAGLELDIFGGYLYKYNDDLSLNLELKATTFPGAHADLPTKDKFNMVELTPGISYKNLDITLAYSLTNAAGVNKNFAPTFTPPLTPNGGSKGSFYVEGTYKYPLIEDTLDWNLTYGYQHIRHYTKLNYSTVGTGLTYTTPESFGGLSLSVNLSATNAKKSLYTATNNAGRNLVLTRPRIWFGIGKDF